MPEPTLKRGLIMEVLDFLEIFRKEKDILQMKEQRVSTKLAKVVFNHETNFEIDLPKKEQKMKPNLYNRNKMQTE
jgi:hypothetical protein